MTEPCKYEDRIMSMAEGVADTRATIKAMDRRINGSIDHFLCHIKNGVWWRTTIAIIAAAAGERRIIMVH